MLAEKNFSVLQNFFKEPHYKISVRLEMDFDSARQALLRRGPGGLKHIDIRCLAIQQWIREERAIAWTRGYEKQHSTSRHFLEGPRTQQPWTLTVGHTGSERAIFNRRIPHAHEALWVQRQRMLAERRHVAQAGEDQREKLQSQLDECVRRSRSGLQL